MNNTDNNNFKFITFASNKNGTKIYCRLTYNNKTILRGYYDFTQEKFIITNYTKTNFQKGVGKNTTKAKLKEILQQDYDWNI